GGRVVALQVRDPLGQAPDDVLVREPEPDDVTTDFTGDGDHDDTVLGIMDATSGMLRTICPADDVVVGGDAAISWRPQAAGEARGCPPGPDLNGDGDTLDRVVHVVRGAWTAVNLGRAASSIAASDRWIALVLKNKAKPVPAWAVRSDGA